MLNSPVKQNRSVTYTTVTDHLDASDCDACFGVGWIFNDEAQMPFYVLDLNSMLPGDEIIRCVRCRS